MHKQVQMSAFVEEKLRVKSEYIFPHKSREFMNGNSAPSLATLREVRGQDKGAAMQQADGTGLPQVLIAYEAGNEVTRQGITH